MLGFYPEVKKGISRLSGEVDGAEWFSFKDAPVVCGKAASRGGLQRNILNIRRGRFYTDK